MPQSGGGSTGELSGTDLHAIGLFSKLSDAALEAISRRAIVRRYAAEQHIFYEGDACQAAYFVLGGRHVQFNPVEAATLRDAQENPGKYPELTVKVSGYSARFVELSPSLQEDIIARTEFKEV